MSLVFVPVEQPNIFTEQKKLRLKVQFKAITLPQMKDAHCGAIYDRLSVTFLLGMYLKLSFFLLFLKKNNKKVCS